MEVVVMPKLGFNMDEGKLMAWYKQEGEAIRKGEPLFSIETDKTNIDVEATLDGVVRKLLIAEGDTIPVTLPIAIIAGADEDISETLASLAPPSTAGNGSGGAPASGSGSTSATASISASAPETASAAGSIAPPAIAADNSAYEFDVFVVGGGPGGYVAAIRACQLGLRTAIAEKDAFGGVCLNRGCIPTKTLLRSLAALNEVKEAAAYGVAGVDAKMAVLDMAAVRKRKDSVREGLVSGVEGLLKKNKATVLKGEAKVKDKHTVRVEGRDITAANLIIATGSDTKGLPVGIVQKKNVLTSDTLLDAVSLPKEIVIIGGGVIGVEFAYFLSGAGAKVTIVEFLERILPPVDAEIAGLVHRDLEASGIAIHTSAKVTRVTDDAVVFEKDGKPQTIQTTDVLMAVGRVPSIPADVLALGIQTERGAVVTDERLRTSVDGVYAIGDVNGKAMLAHTASAEGIVAVENIAGMDAKMDYSAIPSAIYTKPEVASCGLTEEAARTKHGEIKIGRFPLAANGKSKVEGDTRGLVKVITEPQYGEILGVHLYCLHATDMIAEAVVAMRTEATAEEIAKSIHPHPTVSEAVNEAFHAVLGGAIHC